MTDDRPQDPRGGTNKVKIKGLIYHYGLSKLELNWREMDDTEQIALQALVNYWFSRYRDPNDGPR